jgi:alpha-beta hydrolase superfamily lysophospholipase
MLDVWGFTPGIVAPHERVAYPSVDGVRLVASYLPGPSRPGAGLAALPAVVLAHGFAAHRNKPAYVYLAQRMAGVAAILAVDLRGHGESGGMCSFGDREALDLLASAAWLRRRGHRWVAVVGASMGGIAAVRAAGKGPPGTFDAVCLISTPAVWGLTDTAPMRTLHRVVTDRWYRAAASAMLRVRIATGWAYPRAPLELVGRVAPTPLLVVHGIDDHFFSLEQARLLVAAAGSPCTLWLEPAGFGHAEDGFTPGFADRLSAALLAVWTTGQWGPDRPAPT